MEFGIELVSTGCYCRLEVEMVVGQGHRNFVTYEKISGHCTTPGHGYIIKRRTPGYLTKFVFPPVHSA